jgi:2-dehydro-3-deoxyphosphogluconate aldolase/(4S)-4-hydroxy-2-oxoglutarate aldolase
MGPSDVEAIVDGGVVAIIRLDSAQGLVDVAGAIAAGGVTTIEFTMTTPCALEVLAKAVRELTGVTLGAGTVLDAETARAAILAGARFIVSPTLSPAVIATCNRYGVAAVPGALSPTELLAAAELGAPLVKLFPAATLGPGYVRDVLAPLPQLKMIATGGINLENAGAFIKAGASAIAVGSSLVDRATVASGSLDVLTDRAAAFRALVKEARAGAQNTGRH